MTSLRLPAEPASAAAARSFVRAELGALYDASLRDDALLLTSELVTNAVMHARTGVELTVSTSAESVHIEVADSEEQVVPIPRAGTLDELGGRGLALVEALATRWGVRLAPPGKVVWFDLPAPTRLRPAAH